MSRLIIKNLPTHTDPTHLRAHFAQTSGPGGTITDVKVALKRDGTSRRFGFVGYKTEKEAEAARRWFDGTFLGAGKMQVAVVDVSYIYIFREKMS
jgi:multiple RNA-binding domain-containing protein 1